jgi:hypothetical protein
MVPLGHQVLVIPAREVEGGLVELRGVAGAGEEVGESDVEEVGGGGGEVVVYYVCGAGGEFAAEGGLEVEERG